VSRLVNLLGVMMRFMSKLAMVLTFYDFPAEH